MTLDISQVSHPSGRRALQLALSGEGTIQDITSLLVQQDKEASESRDRYSPDHTALEVAACAGHVDAVGRLLAAGADPNAPVSAFGRSVLEAAAAHGQLATVHKLLENGALVDQYAEFGKFTPLIAATKARHTDVAIAILQAGADVTLLRYYDRNSAIKAAAETSNMTLLQLFLKAGSLSARGLDAGQQQPGIYQGQRTNLRQLRLQKCIDAALVAAGETGDLHIIQRLLDAGANVTAYAKVDSWHKYTPIQAAAANGHLEAVDMLLETSSQKKIDVEVITGALQAAVDAGQPVTVERLLQIGADATKIDISKAAEKGHLNVLVNMLRRGASAEPERNIRKETPLQSAAREGHIAVIDMLLANGADANAAAKEQHGGTALQLAAGGGHLMSARRLIDAGADVNAPAISPFADTALQAAARGGGTAMLDLMLAAGAVLDTAKVDNLRQKTTLSVAAEANNSQLVAILLSMMSSEAARLSAPAALQHAVKNHNAQMTRQLLELHPDVNSHDSHQATLLQMAAENGDWEIFDILLAEKADVNLNPTRGYRNTALQSASKWGCLKAVNSLIAAGAEVNVTGSTAPPLLLAIQHGHTEIFEYLLAEGADLHATAYRGQTTLQAAEASIHPDLKQRVLAALDSRPLPLVEQPPDRGTGTLCETCRKASLPRLFGMPSERPRQLHPSLVTLRSSATAGCPFCCFLWKQIGRAPISVPQPSPVTFYRQSEPGLLTCEANEPFPRDVERPERFRMHFHFAVGPLGEYEAPIPGDTASTETYRQIRTWLNICNDRHPKCRSQLETSFLPTRLIHLDSLKDSALGRPIGTAFGPKLISTDGLDSSRTKYMALSYRWPQIFPEEAKLTRSTLQERYRGLDLSRFPQVFNDVFEVAATLDINYLWIDSLCIIQDDLEDWNREAAQMCQIYRHAYLVLAVAVEPSDSHPGMFRRGEIDPYDRLPTTFSCQQDDGSNEEVVVMKDKLEIYEKSPLVTRGWCFQEREISQRMLHYTETQVLWECRTMRASEALPNGVAPHELWPSRILDKDLSLEDVKVTWRRAVEDYSSRNLTNASDKLPALAGLAAAISVHKPAGGRYFAGIWEDDLLSGLAWLPLQTTRLSHIYTPPTERYPDFIAPSWSWASVVGPVSYDNLSASPSGPFGLGHHDIGNNSVTQASSAVKHALQVFNVSLQTSGSDPYGAVRQAVITCTASLIPVVRPDGGVVSISWRYATMSLLETLCGGKIGGVYFDDRADELESRYSEMSCAYLGVQGCDTAPSLVLVPTGTEVNEFRRIGIIPTMDLSYLHSAETKVITII